MRVIPIESVRENSLLGKNIYSPDGTILLKKGAILTQVRLNRIKQLNMLSVCVIDEYSCSEIEDVIKPELRQKCVSSIKQTFDSIEKLSSSDILRQQDIKNFALQQHLYLESISNIAEELLDNILGNENLLLSLVDIKSMDNYTYSHCVNVAVISLVIGISLKLPRSKLVYLCTGALLHDIGKIFIPKEILLKPGKLTDEEFDIIKTHPKLGYDFLYKFRDLSSHCKAIVLQHHERYDGNGYPNQMIGCDINCLARIVTVADVYDALTSDRPYKRAMCPSDALEFLMSNSGSLFDYEIVNMFCKVIVAYPNGTLVSLSTGDIAVVEETLPQFPLRPIVKIVKSDDAEKIGININLINNLSIVILDVCYDI